MPHTWFTSDTHLGHANILKLGKGRAFATIEEHDETIIERWNARVAPGDEVWHLGDFSYRAPTDRAAALFARLRGTKRLVVGNHDNDAVKALPWAEVANYAKIKCEGETVVLFHYPLREWDQFWRGTLHLHGHVHGTHAATRRSCDVAVDVWDFAPVGLTRLIQHMRLQPDADPRVLPEALLDPSGAGGKYGGAAPGIN